MFTKSNKIYYTVFKYSHESQMESFNSYISDIENKFISDVEALSKSYDEHVKNLPGDIDYMETVNEYFGEQHSEIMHQTNNIFRRSVVSSLYSQLETSLENITKTALKIKGKTLTERKEGSIIDHYKKNLEKNGIVDFSTIQNEWSFICDAREIRNNIIHSNGKIPLDNKKKPILIAIENKKIGISINNLEIKIEREYLTNLSSNIDKTLKYVIEGAFK
ncbi:hypothetical protein FE224_13580 [Serratia marcescens]|uniref:hypothetical protein n=1 Tax=Serratia marcescens TaxID=615 RepID=UPI001593AE7F|nr:hypothetical protein [Serratia marcescens]NVC32895.1 hypothetical protein [Serratia marcescens]NVC46225.1 hypothetical protein [Serratia marcescens]QLB23792.1 hypothetical protein FEF07_00345 [Serratia marcescens]